MQLLLIINEDLNKVFCIPLCGPFFAFDVGGYMFSSAMTCSVGCFGYTPFWINSHVDNKTVLLCKKTLYIIWFSKTGLFPFFAAVFKNATMYTDIGHEEWYKFHYFWARSYCTQSEQAQVASLPLSRWLVNVMPWVWWWLYQWDITINKLHEVQNVSRIAGYTRGFQ